MTTATETTEILNDLIRINYDRISGYRKAAEESKKFDIKLRSFFQGMADENRLNVSSLTERVRSLGGEAEHDATTMGKIYRAWMDVKATFTGRDRTSIIASCEYGEDQAQNAYDEAFKSDTGMDIHTKMLILSQKETLEQSHDKIKAMRDAGR